MKKLIILVILLANLLILACPTVGIMRSGTVGITSPISPNSPTNITSPINPANPININSSEEAKEETRDKEQSSNESDQKNTYSENNKIGIGEIIGGIIIAILMLSPIIIDIYCDFKRQ